MEDGVPTTDNEGYQHSQQPIPSTEDGESAANRLRVGIQHEQEIISGPTESTSALTAQSLTRAEVTDDVIGVEETTTTSTIYYLTHCNLNTQYQVHVITECLESLVILCTI